MNEAVREKQGGVESDRPLARGEVPVVVHKAPVDTGLEEDIPLGRKNGDVVVKKKTQLNEPPATSDAAGPAKDSVNSEPQVRPVEKKAVEKDSPSASETGVTSPPPSPPPGVVVKPKKRVVIGADGAVVDEVVRQETGVKGGTQETVVKGDISATGGDVKSVPKDSVRRK